MGQRAKFAIQDQYMDKCRFIPAALRQLSIFPTNAGWFGLLGSHRAVAVLTIGHASADEVREDLWRRCLGRHAGVDLVEADWFPDLRGRLEQYACGVKVEFTDCEVRFPPLTPFQQRVLNAARRIEYGRTATYLEVAAEAGSPRAARAVGNVMASNCVPIIIPCHRVVPSSGKLGGYSAPQGAALKQWLLDLESATG